MSGPYPRERRPDASAPVKFGAWPPTTEDSSGGARSSRPWTPRSSSSSRRRGAVLAFSGEGGIGKTRLLDELGGAPAPRGHLVLTGRASELERELPFGVWEDALAEHAEFLGVDRLERLVGDQLPELAAVLPTVGRVPAGLQDERYRTHRAVRALLEALAQRQPLVLALDDLHWADDSSLELVAHLLRRPPRGRVALALAFRPAPIRPLLATALATAERDGSVIEHTLGALSFADAEALLGTASPAPVRGEIYEAGGGNPFFLQQLARQHAAGRSVAAEPAGAGVPRAVARALEQEIAALSEDGPAARPGRRGGGRPGRPRPRDRRRRRSDEAEALDALDELLAGALLAGTDVPRRYRFRHPLVRLRDLRLRRRGLADRRAQPRRGGAGRARRLAGGARPSPRALRAARRRRGARGAGRGRPPRGGARAGDRRRPLRRRTPAAARDARDVPRRLELLVGLAQALAATGRLEQALAALGDGLALVGPELAPVRARLVAGCAMCENLLGRHAAAHARLLGRAGRARRRRLVRGRRPRGRARRRRALRHRLRRRASNGRSGRGRRPGDRHAGPSPRSRSRSSASARSGRAQIADAQALREDAAARLDALDDGALAGRLDTAYYLGFAEFFCEHYDDAIRHFRRGIAVSRASGQGQFVIPMTIGLAHALEVRGRLAEAAEHADAAVEGARLWGNDQMLCFALTADAWVSALRGELSRARAPAPRRWRCSTGLDESVLSRATRVHVAAAQLEAGEPEGCLAAMSAGGAPEFPGVEPGRRAWLYAILARAELALGRPAAAREWVERGEAGAAGLGLPYAEAAVLCARAQLDSYGGTGAAGGRARRLGRRRDPGRRARDARGQRRRRRRSRSRCSSAPSPSSAASAPCACATRPRASCGAAASRRARGAGARPAATGSRAQRPRARGRRPGRARPHQQADRGRALPVREDDREPHEPALRQARRPPARGGRRGRRARARRVKSAPAMRTPAYRGRRRARARPPVARRSSRPPFRGQAIVPTGTTFKETTVGGLSSITYDAKRGRYYAISDDQGQFQPTRFYTLGLDVRDGRLADGDVRFTDVTTLLAPNGLPYPALSLDPEGLVLTKDRKLIYTSEGIPATGIDPFVRRSALDGSFRGAFEVPDAFLVANTPLSGVRPNLGFESAGVTPDGRSLFTANEGALYQDGPPATPTAGSPVRILRYSLPSGWSTGSGAT